MLTMTATTMKPYTRSRGTDASAWYLGRQLVTFLATGEDTDGQFGLMEFRSRKGGEPPAHIHHGEDECFYVVDGAITFHVGDQIVQGQPGTWVVIPRGTVHSFAIDTEEVTVLVLFTPAGFERFFQELSQPALSVTEPPPPSGPPDIPHLIAVGAKYGCEFLAPA